MNFVLLGMLVCLARPACSRELIVCDDVTDPLTLDPQKEFSEKNHTINQQIFDGLLRFDARGKIEPALAASWERITDTRLRFKLREGVTFHNEEPFDAEAVKFSVERYLNPETAYPGLPFIDSISHAEVVDAHTVDIVTKYPDGIILHRLAGLILMAPPKYIKEKGADYFARHPVGTGAFVFRKWEKGSRIELAANGNYWLSGYPGVGGLIFKFIPYEKQVEALFAGEIDLITDLPGTQTLKVKSNSKFTVLKKPAYYTMPFSLNLASGPLSSLAVRKALNHAVNKEKLIRYDLLGNGVAIATLSMPGETGHDPSLKPYRYDPDRARKLLAEAGYPNGFSVGFLVKKNAGRTAKMVAADLKRVGVDVRITQVSDADMIGEFKSGRYGMFIGSCPDPLSHSYFIQGIVLFSKSPYAWGGDRNFDDRLIRMVAAADPAESERLALENDRYVYDNAMSIFTYQKMLVSAFDKTLYFEPYITGAPYFFRAKFAGKEN